MAGIYIHIPFCKRKCHYCNFFSLASSKNRPEFLEALLKEIALRKQYLKEEDIDTIYFGGGTPSLLSTDELQRILDSLGSLFSIKHDAEITLEANPDDLSKRYLEQLNSTAINRLSIGIQSFNDKELQYVNRVHTAAEAISCVKAAQDAGFHHLSLDLIYGIPNSSLITWENNLKIIESLKPSHLSAYSLTQEPNTAYDVLVKKGKLEAPLDTKAITQYNILQQMLPQLHMEQYEISNYAIPHKYAVHNTNYWRGVSYLGLGPSAHSYNGISRQWNISNITKYIASIDKREIPAEQESLSKQDQWNEFVMTGIRTKWGINTQELENRFPKEWIENFIETADQWILKKQIDKMENTYTLSNTGKLFADGIASSFFV